MTVYIIRGTGYQSHLLANTTKELHEFASHIHLDRECFRQDSLIPYYDVDQNKRQDALQLEAVHLPICNDGWIEIFRQIEESIGASE